MVGGEKSRLGACCAPRYKAACTWPVSWRPAWQWLDVTVEQGTLKKIRDDMFAHQQKLPIRYFDSHEHGDIAGSHYTNDTDTLRQASRSRSADVLLDHLRAGGAVHAVAASVHRVS